MSVDNGILTQRKLIKLKSMKPLNKKSNAELNLNFFNNKKIDLNILSFDFESFLKFEKKKEKKTKIHQLVSFDKNKNSKRFFNLSYKNLLASREKIITKYKNLCEAKEKKHKENISKGKLITVFQKSNPGLNDEIIQANFNLHN